LPPNPPIVVGGLVLVAGFPHGIEKVWNFKIGFQDLEKVLKLAKMYIKY